VLSVTYGIRDSPQKGHTMVGVYLTRVHLTSMYLMGRCLTGVHLKCVYLVRIHFIGVCLMGLYLMGVHLIYESSLRAGHGWREFLYRHQRCLKLLNCGRLGRQAADHPWSALRVVKAAEKTAQRPRCCSKPKAAALHPERYQSSLSKLSKRGGSRRGKEAQAIGLAS
jgi:hypothetical protein